MSDRQERFPRVNAMAREDGWGVVTDAALGILPENVESQARGVAKWAADRIKELEAKLATTTEAAFFEGFSEGRDGTWVEGDPSPAWRDSETRRSLSGAGRSQ